MQCSIAGVEVSVTDSHDAFWHQLAEGRWEPDTLRVFAANIDRQTTVIDIGAWIGPTALYAAALGRRVFAFEPDPVAFRTLQENVSRNGHLGEVVAVNAAVTVGGGRARLFSSGGLGNSLGSLVRGSDDLVTDCDAVRLEDFLETAGVSGPLFIKLDVEGYEFALSPALLPLLRAPTTTLLVSLHPQFIARRERHSLREKILNRFEFGLQVARLFWPLRALDLRDDQGFPISATRVIRAAFLRGSLEMQDRMLLVRGK